LLYLSRDLKPNRELEKKRIEYRKGYVSNDGRLLGIINVSRAFGDWKFKDKNKQYLLGKENTFDEYLITNKAEFRLYEFKPKEDYYVILASDGIFQNNSTQQVFGLINDYLSRDKNDNNNNNLYLKNIPNIVDNVRLEIVNNNIIDNSDNMTMIMLQLNNK
jgi:serine/threonine protein phosphatase PrpC